MPDNALTMAELEEIRDEAMADDLEIDFEKMTLWTRDEAVAFFESGEEPPPPWRPATNIIPGGGRETPRLRATAAARATRGWWPSSSRWTAS